MTCLRIRCSKCRISFSTVRALLKHRDAHDAGPAAGTDPVVAFDSVTSAAGAERRDAVAIGANS